MENHLPLTEAGLRRLAGALGVEQYQLWQSPCGRIEIKSDFNRQAPADQQASEDE